MSLPRGRQNLLIIIRELTDYRWEEIEAFIRASRDGMKDAWDKFNKKFDETVKGYTEDQVQDEVEFLADEITVLRNGSPILMNHSHCLIIYGTFENSLAKFCHAIHRDGKIVAKPARELHVSTCRRYLQPHLPARPNAFGKEFEWMDEFRIIRNWIAHNGGLGAKDIDVNGQPQGKWARAQIFLHRNRGMIKMSHHQEIVAEPALVDRAIQRAKDALARIEKAASKLY